MAGILGDTALDDEIATTSGALDKGWDSWGDAGIVTTSDTLDKGWDSWGDTGIVTTSGTFDQGWDSWGDAGIATTSGLSQTTGLTHPMALAKQKMVNGQYEGETHDEFFKRWAIKCEQWIATESAIQKQSRESHANHAKQNICPSKWKSWTKIFKWEGKDEQVQEVVYHRAWSHKWEIHSDSKHFYHDQCDEWDLCEALDPGVLPNFDMDNSDDDFMPPPY